MPLGSKSGSVALQQQQQGSVTTKGQTEVPGLGCYTYSIFQGLCRTDSTPHLGILGELTLEA